MDDEVLQRVQLALAQAKRVARESRISVQQLARLRDELEENHSPGGTGNEHKDRSMEGS